MKNNNLDIKIYQYHSNGTVGEWDVRYWLQQSEGRYNETFPLQELFPSQDGRPVIGKELRIVHTPTEAVLSFRISGDQTHLPAICKMLHKLDEEGLKTELALLYTCLCYKKNYKCLVAGCECQNWYDTLEQWKKAHRVFVVKDWDDLFANVNKYAYVFEQVPASLSINEETLRFINKDELKKSVRKLFDIYFFAGRMVGVAYTYETDVE